MSGRILDQDAGTREALRHLHGISSGCDRIRCIAYLENRMACVANPRAFEACIGPNVVVDAE